jgi:hypothetical protein
MFSCETEKNGIALMSDPEILGIASALDSGDPLSALSRLLALSPGGTTPLEQELFLPLARRAMLLTMAQGKLDGRALQDLQALIDATTPAALHRNPWLVSQQIQAALSALAPGQTMALALHLTWDALPDLPYEVQYEILSLAFLHGHDQRLADLWQHLLAQDPGFVPDYWQFQSLARSLSDGGGPLVEEVFARLCETAGRADLMPLFGVYTGFLRQTQYGEALAAAAHLDDPVHRRRVAEYLLGAAQTDETLPAAVALHEALTGPTDQAPRAFQQARLATAEGRWQDVLALTENILNHSEFGHPALCLRALALMWTGQTETAHHMLDHLRLGGHAAWFIAGKADQIAVTGHCLQRGQPAPGATPAPALSVLAGRPLAQSLWVGPRLRWIEEASIRSYLANGWRYQLYTYEVPENVPDGAEILDATAILPRSELFTESASSGMHKGSVGAFSDMFRYALLLRRGGMWTDTDVINLDRFDPDGARFIATERMDAGVIGLNGAMMAAPSGCAFQRLAFERAQALRAAGPIHFTRIGPQLLAQLVASGATDSEHGGYDLLPSTFLNPIGWMETGRLLAPFATVARLPLLAHARNIHVYTETWRLIGLNLAAEPQGTGFLATLSRRLRETRGQPVRSLLET